MNSQKKANMISISTDSDTPGSSPTTGEGKSLLKPSNSSSVSLLKGNRPYRIVTQKSLVVKQPANPSTSSSQDPSFAHKPNRPEEPCDTKSSANATVSSTTEENYTPTRVISVEEVLRSSGISVDPKPAPLTPPTKLSNAITSTVTSRPCSVSSAAVAVPSNAFKTNTEPENKFTPVVMPSPPPPIVSPIKSVSDWMSDSNPRHSQPHPLSVSSLAQPTSSNLPSSLSPTKSALALQQPNASKHEIRAPIATKPAKTLLPYDTRQSTPFYSNAPPPVRSHTTELPRAVTQTNVATPPSLQPQALENPYAAPTTRLHPSTNPIPPSGILHPSLGLASPLAPPTPNTYSPYQSSQSPMYQQHPWSGTSAGSLSGWSQQYASAAGSATGTASQYGSGYPSYSGYSSAVPSYPSYQQGPAQTPVDWFPTPNSAYPSPLSAPTAQYPGYTPPQVPPTSLYHTPPSFTPSYSLPPQPQPGQQTTPSSSNFLGMLDENARR